MRGDGKAGVVRAAGGSTVALSEARRGRAWQVAEIDVSVLRRG